MKNSHSQKRTADRILKFWFGDLKDCEVPNEEYTKRWWNKDTGTDRLIEELFLDDLEEVKRIYSDDIELSPKESLALIILLDQFTRNVYRDTHEAFSGDEAALSIALKGISFGSDLSLKPIQRIFYYMPLMHSEDLEVQKLSIEQFKKLENAFSEPPELCENLRGSRVYAEKHAEIIKRFGRYPHRNDKLGRKSTEEEQEFLNEPGSSF